MNDMLGKYVHITESQALNPPFRHFIYFRFENKNSSRIVYIIEQSIRYILQIISQICHNKQTSLFTLKDS